MNRFRTWLSKPHTRTNRQMLVGSIIQCILQGIENFLRSEKHRKLEARVTALELDDVIERAVKAAFNRERS